MLELLKKLFGSKAVESTVEVPYKVEAPVVSSLSDFPVETAKKAPASAKKPAAKDKPARAKKPVTKK